MGVETLAMIALISSAAGTAYSASEQHSAGKAAKSAAQAAEDRASAAAREAAELPQRQAAAAAAAAQETLQRKAARTKTLLTSSMGVLNGAEIQKKTLLGA